MADLRDGENGEYTPGNVSDRGGDPEVKDMVYGGATVSQLAYLFKRDRRTVLLKITGKVKPKSVSDGGVERYDIAEAAQYLIKPNPEDLADALRTLRKGDIPPFMQKEFWDAALKRQRWEREAGQLWTSDEVVAGLGEVFKILRMSLMLLADNVSRETELTERQRGVINAMVDDTLADIAEKLQSSERLREIKNIREGFNFEEEVGADEDTATFEVPPLDAEAMAEVESEKRTRRRKKNDDMMAFG